MIANEQKPFLLKAIDNVMDDNLSAITQSLFMSGTTDDPQIVDWVTAIKIFKDYQGKTYFNPQTQQTHPFLITIKVKGTICYALTNDTYGINLFLKQNPILLNKLKEFNDKTR